MFYIALPVCVGIHIANNARSEPNVTLNRITSYAIPLLATVGLGLAAGRYPGNFLKGISVTFLPPPVARALSAFNAMCIEHTQDLLTVLRERPGDYTPLFLIVAAIVTEAPHFLAVPIIAGVAYYMFGLINIVMNVSSWLDAIHILITFIGLCIIAGAYVLRLNQENAQNPV